MAASEPTQVIQHTQHEVRGYWSTITPMYRALAVAIMVMASIALVLGESLSTYARQEHLSPRARKLTQALVALRNSPRDTAVQQTYLRAFPHNYKDFLALFEVGHELYDGHDFIEPLSSVGKQHPLELGELLVALSKDAHYEADAPSSLQQTTATYAIEHSRTFVALLKQLPPAKQRQLITFLADVENFPAYPEYQEIIDHLNRMGEQKLAIAFEGARTNVRRSPLVRGGLHSGSGCHSGSY